MKVSFLFFAVLLVSLFYGCSDDDNSLSTNQVGTWKVNESRIIYMDDSLTFDLQSTYDLTLNADGSGVKSSIFLEDDVLWCLHEGAAKISLIAVLADSTSQFFISNVYDIVENRNALQRWESEVIINSTTGVHRTVSELTLERNE